MPERYALNLGTEHTKPTYISLQESKRTPGKLYIARANKLPLYTELLNFIDENESVFGLNDDEVEKAHTHLQNAYTQIQQLLYNGGEVSTSGTSIATGDEAYHPRTNRITVETKSEGPRHLRKSYIIPPGIVALLEVKRIRQRNTFSVPECRITFPNKMIASASGKLVHSEVPILIGHQLAIDSMIYQTIKDYKDPHQF